MTSYATAAVMAIHLLFHLKYLANMFKKILAGIKLPIVRRTISSAAAVLFVAGILYYNAVATAETDFYAELNENKYTVSDPPTTDSNISSDEEESVTWKGAKRLLIF